MFPPDRTMRLAPLACALLVGAAAPAIAATPITLTQAMADPDWIGPPVERAWWRWDGQAAQYLLKREGATIRDTWEVALAGGAPRRVDDGARAQLDGAGMVFDAGNTRAAFVRDLGNGALS